MNRLLAGALTLTAALLVASPGFAQNPCAAPDNGTGTVTLPPDGCEYLSPSQVHMIINGLPAGTTIILKPIHLNFICRQTGGGVPGTNGCEQPGGTLGGAVENFNSQVVFQVSGTGTLSGLNETVTVPAAVEVHSSPKSLGASVQNITTNMRRIQGSVANSGSFGSLSIVGGTANGINSPGSTTLTRQANQLFSVNSTFNVGYRISFVGATSGKLKGLSGTTEGTVQMKAYDIDGIDN